MVQFFKDNSQMAKLVYLGPEHDRDPTLLSELAEQIRAYKLTETKDQSCMSELRNTTMSQVHVVN